MAFYDFKLLFFRFARQGKISIRSGRGDFKQLKKAKRWTFEANKYRTAYSVDFSSEKTARRVSDDPPITFQRKLLCISHPHTSPSTP